MTVHKVSYRISFFPPRIYGLHPSLRKRRKKIALAQSKFAFNVSRISSKPRKSYDFINSSCFSSFFKPWLTIDVLKTVLLHKPRHAITPKGSLQVTVPSPQDFREIYEKVTVTEKAKLV